MPIISLFCEIDDFFLAFEKQMMPPLRARRTEQLCRGLLEASTGCLLKLVVPQILVNLL